MKTPELTEEEETARGQELVRLLRLRKTGSFNPPRYHTEHGTKTALGLFRTIQDLILNGERKPAKPAAEYGSKMIQVC